MPSTVPKRIRFASLLIALGLGSVAQPAFGQAFLSRTMQLDSALMERTGMSIAGEAEQLARFRQYELALPRAELATQLAPKSYQTWAILGSLYIQTDELDKGVKALQQARSLKPDNAAILFALGAARFQQENYSAAVEELSAGLKLKPNAPGALFDLGNAYYKLNQFEEALAQYEKAFAQEKNFWPAINNIGLVKYERGDIEAAIEQWRAALAIDDKAAEPKLALAVALYSKGEREQGLAMGEAALKLDIRYADLEFLKENLWGARLLADTQKFLQTPRIQATLAQNRDSLEPPKPSP